MGSLAGEGEEKEHPQHRVQLTRAFFLGTHEVSHSQYQRVIAGDLSPAAAAGELPMHDVSWFDAVRFCNHLSIRDQRPPYYRIEGEGDSALVTVIRADGIGYRLPTEAEYEYACRAGSATKFPFGHDESRLGEYAWFNRNSEGQIHPAGMKQPNRWGYIRHARQCLGMVPGWLR